MPPAPRTVEVRNIVTVHEVLKLAGRVLNGDPRQPVPRSTLANWRAKHAFPQPMKVVGRRTELWDQAEVKPWLEAWKARREEIDL